MTKTYYRMAEHKRDVGFVFQGSGKMPLADFPDVDAILEKNRPSTSPSRSDCVYMRDDKDFSTVGISYPKGYVHEVEPVGPVEQHDVYWVGVLLKRRAKSVQFRGDLEPGVSDDEIAQRYWTGVASNKPTWEWVAKEAKVIAVGDDPVIAKPNAPLFNLLNKK